MSGSKSFIDTNILLYLLSADAQKADQAEAVIRSDSLISVQVLNETASVARRKLGLPWTEIKEILALIRSLCPVEPLSVETHDKGMHIAQRYRLNVYDSMILAAALQAGCERVYSEDMQDGLLIEQQLRVVNPFISK